MESMIYYYNYLLVFLDTLQRMIYIRYPRLNRKRLEALFQDMIKGKFSHHQTVVFIPLFVNIYGWRVTLLFIFHMANALMQITKYKDGITPTIDSNRMRQILMYLLSINYQI